MLFQTIFLMIHFLRKRSELFKILLFFSVWIPVLFLPNWLLANNEMVLDGKVLGMTHRYLTLSAVGLVCWLGVALSAIRNNYLKIILLLIIIISNIFTANRILKQDWFYRSTSITNPIWDSIEKDVPFGEKNSLFTFQGEDKTMVGIIAQAKVPFGIRRGIKNFEELPKSTVDSQLVKALLCGQEVGIPKIPLSHFYVWQITGNTIENISEKARKDYSGRDCDLKY